MGAALGATPDRSQAGGVVLCSTVSVQGMGSHTISTSQFVYLQTLVTIPQQDLFSCFLKGAFKLFVPAKGREDIHALFMHAHTATNPSSRKSKRRSAEEGQKMHTSYLPSLFL